MSPVVSDPEQVLRLREQTAKLEAQLEKARSQKQRDQLEKQLAALNQDLLDAGFEDLDDEDVAKLTTDLPLTLLPVRIETRFARGRRGAELLVRIYPDQLHQDTHELELTDAETEWGRHFWEQRWRAGGDGELEAAAWAQLAARFTPRRAAWVARALRPKNPEDRPAKPLAEDDKLDPEPTWPKVGQRESAWTRAPRARLLPDRFVAIGYRDGSRLFVHWGEPVGTDPAVGPSPEAKAVDFHGLKTDEDMLWMLDFERALSIGMALRIEKPTGLEKGLDRLLVLGVRASSKGKAGDDLAELLLAHQYTDGLGLVPPATPTNNADGGTRAGYADRASAAPEGWLGDDPSASAPKGGTDGALLATALGLNPEGLVDVEGVDGAESARSGLMQAVLWPGSGGYALQQLFSGTLSAAEQEQFAEHVEQHVRPGGPLPVVRMGTQPYGVLPVAPPATLVGAQTGAGMQLAVAVLEALRPIWLDSLDRVPRVPSADPDADLLELLGSDARSAAYAARPLLGPEYLDGLIALSGSADPAADRADLQARSAHLVSIFQSLGLGATPPITRSFYSEGSALLRAPVVQEAPLSDTEDLDDGYLDWLLKANFADVLAGYDSQAKPFGDRRQPLLWLVAGPRCSRPSPPRPSRCSRRTAARGVPR